MLIFKLYFFLEKRKQNDFSNSTSECKLSSIEKHEVECTLHINISSCWVIFVEWDMNRQGYGPKEFLYSKFSIVFFVSFTLFIVKNSFVSFQLNWEKCKNRHSQDFCGFYAIMKKCLAIFGKCPLKYIIVITWHWHHCMRW